MQKILLIEPDRPLAQTYQTVLENAGYAVFWCPHAQLAIIAADKMKPSLVIIELKLAAHSGIEFLYEFRSYPDWVNVPVLVLSSVPMEESGVAGRLTAELNLAGYLYKPQTSLKKLSATVEKLLAPKRPKAKAGATNAR